LCCRGEGDGEAEVGDERRSCWMAKERRVSVVAFNKESEESLEAVPIGFQDDHIYE
jgi:hypothetical protein